MNCSGDCSVFGVCDEVAQGSLHCVQNEAAVTAHVLCQAGVGDELCPTPQPCVCVSGLSSARHLHLGVLFGFVTG